MPRALQVSWLELAETGTGSFRENPSLAGVCGTAGSSAPGSGGPGAEAAHRFVASLFLLIEKNIHSCIQILQSNCPVAGTVLACPCHGANIRAWKETLANVIINNVWRNASAGNVSAGINSGPRPISCPWSDAYWAPSKRLAFVRCLNTRQNSHTWPLSLAGEPRRKPPAQWRYLLSIYSCTSRGWSHWSCPQILWNGYHHPPIS